MSEKSTTPNLSSSVEDSLRAPILFVFFTSIGCLLLGCLLKLIVGLKLIVPELFSFCAETSYGRLSPVATHIFLYGWAFPMALGIALWILARLKEKKLTSPTIFLGGVVLWNIGVIVGVIGILIGENMTFLYLEFPSYAQIILFSGYLCMVLPLLMLLKGEGRGGEYISVAYILAAIFCLPWLWGTAYVLNFYAVGVGFLKPIVNSFYANGVLKVFLGGITLGVLYYLAPKLTSKPLKGYWLVGVAFWTFLIFSLWGGTNSMTLGPYPAWITSVGIASKILFLVPLTIIYLNFFNTLEQQKEALKESLTLRFVFMSAIFFIAASWVDMIISFRGISRFFQFTIISEGQRVLYLDGFVTLGLCAGIYYITSLLLKEAWGSAKKIRIHFWCVVIGVVLKFSFLVTAGMLQGFALEDAKIPFSVVTSLMNPIFWMVSLGDFLIMIGQASLAISFVLIFYRRIKKNFYNVGGGNSSPQS